MKSEPTRVQRIIQKGRVVSMFTTLGISGMTLLGLSAVLFSADLWLPTKFDYALQSDFNPQVKNLATLPEHNYLIGCVASFPAENTQDAVSAKTFFDVTENTQLKMVSPVGKPAVNLLKSTVTESAILEGAQPLLAAVGTEGKSSFSGFSLLSGNSQVLKGLTTANCVSAQTHSWFVAGNTAVGEATHLTLINPSGNATQVILEAWNGSGRFSHSPTLTVAANSTQVVNLASFFPDEERLGVHVSVAGPGAVAVMHTAGEKGLASRGFETLSGVNAAAKENIFTGVVAGNAGTRIQILNPQNEVVKATISLADPLGTKPLPGAEGIEIAGSAVFELDLAGLGAGSKTLILSADKPLVASVTSVFEGDDKEDENKLADRVVWTAAAVVSHLQTQLPPLENGEKERQLALFNPGATAIKVKVNGVEIQVPRNSQLTQAVPVGKLTLESDAQVYASVMLSRQQGETWLRTNLQLADPDSALPTLVLNQLD